MQIEPNLGPSSVSIYLLYHSLWFSKSKNILAPQSFQKGTIYLLKITFFIGINIYIYSVSIKKILSISLVQQVRQCEKFPPTGSSFFSFTPDKVSFLYLRSVMQHLGGLSCVIYSSHNPSLPPRERPKEMFYLSAFLFFFPVSVFIQLLFIMLHSVFGWKFSCQSVCLS